MTDLALHNPDAEASVLGALLIEPDLLVHVRPILAGPEAFHAGQYRAVYAAMLALSDRHAPIEHVSLATELQQHGVDGPEMLCAELLDAAVTTANALHHARMVLDAYRRRRLQEEGDRLKRLAADPAIAVIDLVGTISGELVPLGAGGVGEAARSMPALFTDVLFQLEERVRGQVELAGPTTGFERVDDLTDGFTPGELWIGAARPSQGKTAIGLKMASSVAKTGGHVHFTSLEMRDLLLVERLLSEESGANLRWMRRSRYRDYFERMAPRVWDAAKRIGSLPITFDTRSRTPGRLRLTLQAEIAQGRRPALVVVDYLGLMAPDVRQENRNNDLGAISHALKHTALDLDLPILALHQLNRKVETEKRPPELHDLRDSGNIEQDADVVFMLHWPEGKAERGGSAVDLYVRKERNGETGKVCLLFEPWCQRWKVPGMDPDEEGEAA